MKTLADFFPHLLNMLLGIIGFFLVTSYNRTNEQLAQINRDVLILNKELVGLKLELTEMNTKMMTEERVREIFKLEFLGK